MASRLSAVIRKAGAALKEFTQLQASRKRTRDGHRPDALNPRPKAGGARLGYAPSPGHTADPGEIVWTWVPYEDDPSQGKDRPVLIIGTEGSVLLGLMLTSRDRNNESGRDEGYIDIGTGAWDRKGRESEVYLDRVLRVDPPAVRRIGAVLHRSRFEKVIDGLERRAGR
ncbi:hypothetical protein BJ994_001500 [Arthrobacter pigmenti]|uniref:Type II toxin-antitoxin system PemK/MazF family toxin n=1 Tax=Arthrobacter pigmenti TaxID=271432 RepID=A0A846RPV9_9MICC|nr:type II toxin-antitoxin system PemK/MazF family toxin [Arthrobacter pigmenti]NJC22424.1 hypothetical protein [Arthrobacter pigmenti]